MKNETTEKKQRTANIGFAKWRVQCFYDSLVQGSSSVFQIKFCAKNPPLRKAEKRCAAIPAGLRRNDRSASRTAVRRPSGLRTTVRLAKLKKNNRYARLFSTSPSGAVVVRHFKNQHH